MKLVIVVGMSDELRLLKEKYHGEKSPAFFTDCKRLALGEPLAYLIGYTPFLHTTIYLDSKPLIPRPETEYWAQKAIESMSTGTNSLGFCEEPIKVLDMCAGSGCIGVAVASSVPCSLIDLVEIDASHLPTIKKNLIENKIDPARYQIIHSNLFEKVTGTYDYILANPPYIDADLNRVADSVTLHEPHLALFGGAGGLDVIKSLIANAPRHLKAGGQLWFEHEPEQVPAIEQLAKASGFHCHNETDQYGDRRFSVLVLQ